MHQHHCSTPAHRIHLASSLLAHEGEYGFVSQLSREHTISRQSLYTLKSRGQEAMERVFIPKQQPRQQKMLIERAVLLLFTEAHASREGIQHCIEEMLGVHVSLGTVSSIIHKAGQRAQAYLKCQIPAGERIIAIDEQYGEKQGEGYLNIVDAWSFLVLASVPPVSVDSESWELLFLQMEEQGLKWKMVVSDGGKAIQGAVRKSTQEPVHQRDLWHVLHECQKVQRRVDRKVQELQEQTPKVERQAKRVAAGKKPLGRNPKTDIAAHAADLHQMDSVARSLRYLSCELRRLLGIVVLKDQGIIGRRERQEELDALLDLFAELCECAPNGMKQQIKKLFHHVQFALPALVSFCQPLDAVQQKAIQQLGEAALHLIGWAWQHRAILGPKRDLLIADFPPAWQPLAAELLAAWDDAVRSSSAVENTGRVSFGLLNCGPSPSDS